MADPSACLCKGSGRLHALALETLKAYKRKDGTADITHLAVAVLLLHESYGAEGILLDGEDVWVTAGVHALFKLRHQQKCIVWWQMDGPHGRASMSCSFEEFLQSHPCPLRHFPEVASGWFNRVVKVPFGDRPFRLYDRVGPCLRASLRSNQQTVLELAKVFPVTLVPEIIAEYAYTNGVDVLKNSSVGFMRQAKITHFVKRQRSG